MESIPDMSHQHHDFGVLGQMEVDKNVSRLAREKNAEEKRKVKSVATKEMSFSDGRDRMQPLPSMLMRQRKVSPLLLLFLFLHCYSRINCTTLKRGKEISSPDVSEAIWRRRSLLSSKRETGGMC